MSCCSKKEHWTTLIVIGQLFVFCFFFLSETKKLQCWMWLKISVQPTFVPVQKWQSERSFNPCALSSNPVIYLFYFFFQSITLACAALCLQAAIIARSATCSAGASFCGRWSLARSPLMRSEDQLSASCGPCTTVSCLCSCVCVCER